MSIAKNKILVSAERLFAEKGYESTSIQDIADDCSVAKGSLYKFFSSKEALYIELLEHRHSTMLEEVERIRGDAALTKREQFVRITEYQMSFFLRHGFFLRNAHREAPPIPKDQIAPHVQRIKGRLLGVNRHVVIDCYGAELEPYSWEAVVILNAIAKECLHLIILYDKPLSVPELAEYLVDRMDDIVEGLVRRGKPPLLPEAVMTDFVDESSEEAGRCAARCAGMLYEMIRTTIGELSVPNARKRELEQVLDLLREEGRQPEPRKFLILALTGELGREHELASYADRIRLWTEKQQLKD
ncbi:TetR/AcrR family transcriptional regulator [Paenibacillus sp. IB182496]|uniref:TetR/AcrR family transcriptional regulator n=1 Tax=Paenibacillus sabuli TaxID=2772509 RepID=A0A927BRH3_9BACL|nr:TetR/AcrR family transcriptional regulator [Paenibacillus sabuli]MBD2845412.1 TetR/AcrR family transcriptional regulator [Paenibacillus sabuli]